LSERTQVVLPESFNGVNVGISFLLYLEALGLVVLQDALDIA
jgi:hypothetical protein